MPDTTLALLSPSPSSAILPSPSPSPSATKPTMALNHNNTPPGPPPPKTITPAEAAQPCESIGATALLAKLNDLTHQSHTMADSGVQRAIDWCLSQQFDFGSAYGRLRPLWTSPDISTAWAKVVTEQQTIDELRASAFFTDAEGRRTLKHPYVLGPRRIWDLCSHRVVPSAFVLDRRHVWAITHSWRKDMHRNSTPVNEHQWPVPLPASVTLEAVRDELLAMGAVYCWLDVVCIRQSSGLKDAPDPVRDRELEADMPTMGNIYAMAAMVVRYYSGLGLPFSPDGLDDDHHWLNRGWTLQEMNIRTRVGGLGSEERVVPVTGFECDRGEDPFPEFAARLRPLDSIVTATPRLAKVVKAMRPRRTRDDVDKIYGLGYLIKARTLPAYKAVRGDAAGKLEDAWWQLVYCMSDTMHGELLFLFTQPGEYKKRKWLPKWEQLMMGDMVQDMNIDESVRLLPSGKAKYNGYRLGVCEIVGNEVIVKGMWDVDRRFRFERDETCTLGGVYTLVGNPKRSYFVVCKPQVKADDLLAKVFVIHLSPAETEAVMQWGLHRSDCIFR